MSSIAVFASGNGSNFEALAVFFKNDSVDRIKLLVCDRKDAFVIDRAADYNIPVFLVNYPKNGIEQTEKDIITHLNQIQIDLIVLAGFMRILSPFFINNVGIRIVNIHPSILPEYKGAKAIERAYESNDVFSGITIHFVNEEVDGGEIIISEKVAINRELGIEEFKKDIHRLEHRLYPVTVKQILDKMRG